MSRKRQEFLYLFYLLPSLAWWRQCQEISPQNPLLIRCVRWLSLLVLLKKSDKVGLVFGGAVGEVKLRRMQMVIFFQNAAAHWLLITIKFTTALSGR